MLLILLVLTALSGIIAAPLLGASNPGDPIKGSEVGIPSSQPVLLTARGEFLWIHCSLFEIKFEVPVHHGSLVDC